MRRSTAARAAISRIYIPAGWDRESYCCTTAIPTAPTSRGKFRLGTMGARWTRTAAMIPTTSRVLLTRCMSRSCSRRPSGCRLPAESLFRWSLLFLTAVSVLLWLRVLRWRPRPLAAAGMLVLTLGSFAVVQGIKLQQLSLLVGGLLALGVALLSSGQLVAAGAVLAVAMIKPQLAVPLAGWLLLWALGQAQAFLSQVVAVESMTPPSSSQGKRAVDQPQYGPRQSRGASYRRLEQLLAPSLQVTQALLMSGLRKRSYTLQPSCTNVPDQSSPNNSFAGLAAAGRIDHVHGSRRPAKACNQADRPPTRQPVSSGTI